MDIFSTGMYLLITAASTTAAGAGMFWLGHKLGRISAGIDRLKTAEALKRAREADRQRIKQLEAELAPYRTARKVTHGVLSAVPALAPLAKVMR